ncbi:RpiB/LacA/LacB family sugar-phosphate isomerase [Floccifex sp.]|uniref:RpiB/LacA/LacB family sugar-phosphate isomerase n=1 Tax=Floccifex sp. TaxID=2815810 RepID=UPI003F0388DC
MKTKIAIACDDLGFERKQEVIQYLVSEKNAEIVYDPVKCKEDGINTFAKLADEMSELIQRDVCRLGIYICGTGIGFTCQANKHWGIRAVPVSNPYTAKRARLSNNAQIIGLGCRVNGMEYTKMIIDAWYDEPFDFKTARPNSKKNLLEAKKSDDECLVKPVYVSWNMGFTED